MLKRKIEQALSDYYKDQNASIIVINGARQIGKSFIIRETASKAFKNYIEINLQEDFDGNKAFEKVKSIDDFYFYISSQFGEELGNIEDTIIFLDEIQVYPHLLTMLKALKLDSKFRFIASGSLLGITLKHTFIPMGSIQEIKMYPLDFEEFLMATGTGKDVIEHLKQCFINKTKVSDSLHSIMLERFKEYLICGGLPDAVNEFVFNKNVGKTRIIQNSIYNYYKDDASRYDIQYKLKIRNIYDCLPSYMKNKVSRIKFKNIENIDHVNIKRYQDEFDYLINSGCTTPVKAVSNPKFPLIETMSKNLIKLYYNDVGILSNILYKNNIDAILYNDKAINLGSVYETACANELIAHGHELYYFDSKKVGEVDFLVNDYDKLSVLPIEIKSGNNQNNFRAIPKLVNETYGIKQGYVFGNKNIISEKDNIVTYPIYMIMFV